MRWENEKPLWKMSCLLVIEFSSCGKDTGRLRLALWIIKFLRFSQKKIVFLLNAHLSILFFKCVARSNDKGRLLTYLCYIVYRIRLRMWVPSTWYAFCWGVVLFLDVGVYNFESKKALYFKFKRANTPIILLAYATHYIHVCILTHNWYKIHVSYYFVCLIMSCE